MLRGVAEMGSLTRKQIAAQVKKSSPTATNASSNGGALAFPPSAQEGSSSSGSGFPVCLVQTCVS